MKYLIQKPERNFDGAMSWWCPGRRGYTTLVSAAGRYSMEEALRIIQSGTSFAYPEKTVREHIREGRVAVGTEMGCRVGVGVDMEQGEDA